MRQHRPNHRTKAEPRLLNILRRRNHPMPPRLLTRGESLSNDTNQNDGESHELFSRGGILALLPNLKRLQNHISVMHKEL
jgi:hypothetical protein